jgi:hypothetical protein
MSAHIQAEHVGTFFRHSAPEAVAHLEERVGRPLSDEELEVALKSYRSITSDAPVTTAEAVELIARIRTMDGHPLDDAD